MRAWLVVVLLALCACGGKKKDAPAAAVAGDAAGAQVPAPAPATQVDGSADVTTRADCELAVSNMQKVAPALVPGDAADVDECLKLPRPLVLCLQTAASSAAADACVDRAAGSPLDAAVAARASEETCRKMVAHYRSLLPAGERDDSSEASMLAACSQKLTPDDAKCVLAARTRAEAEACLGG